MTSRTTPKDVFLHLLAIGMLYACVTSLLVLLFQYINHLFPDVLSGTYAYRAGASLEAIRSASAALIIVFPVYLLASWLLLKDQRADPGKTEIGVRRWLLHLTLFVAAIIIIVDLITLVYSLLSGELTARFLLKVLAVLLVAAAVFGYYLWELRRRDMRSPLPKQAGIAASAVALLTVVAGFFIIGSPVYQRNLRLDDRRTGDLQRLQGEILNFWQTKNALPPGLSNLQDTISGFTPPVDPLTGNAYEYRVSGPLSFELCATFGAPSLDRTADGVTVPRAVPEDLYAPSNWTHGEGRTCFTRTIDPEKYRLPTKPFP